MGSIPTRFRQLRGETPFKSGVFCYIADWLKLSKNGNLCHYIATVNLKLARFAMKYINESAGFMQPTSQTISYNIYTCTRSLWGGRCGLTSECFLDFGVGTSVLGWEK